MHGSPQSLSSFGANNVKCSHVVSKNVYYFYFPTLKNNNNRSVVNDIFLVL